MMYIPTLMGDRTVYFKNVLSEPENLIKFIEECDLDESTHGYISKWEDLENGNKIKRFLKNESGLSEKQHQKLTYIYNSFYRGILFSREHYLNLAMREAGEIENLSIIKSKPCETHLENFKNDNEDNIHFYIIINSEPDGHPMCVNKKYNVYINPEPNTTIMVPGDVDHNINNNKKEEFYYIVGNFRLTGERLSPVELL